MGRPVRTALAAGALWLAALPTARAEWSADPALNLPIATQPAADILPKVAVLGPGTFVGWFTAAGGAFELRLQYLDARGVPQFPAGGLLVSDHPQASFLVDWDLLAIDNAAVLVFADIRYGPDFDVHAYRIDTTGNFLWGDDGVTLSANDDLDAAPRVAVKGGGFAVVWSRHPDQGDGALMMQYLDVDGASQLEPGGRQVAGSPGESPGFASISTFAHVPDPARGGAAIPSVFVSWVRDVSTFQSPRHVHLNLFDEIGDPRWDEPLVVYDLASVPVAHTPELVGRASPAATLVWHASEANVFQTRVQVVGEDGTSRYPHNGLQVSTSVARHHLDPVAAPMGVDRFDIFVCWRELNLGQSQWGLYAQRLGLNGRLWADEGVELLPVDSAYVGLPRMAPTVNARPEVYWTDTPTTGVERVLAMQLEGQTGQPSAAWPPPPLVVSSAASGKSELVVDANSQSARLAWQDDRHGADDIFAQNVYLADGTMGPEPPTTSITALPAPEGSRVLRSYPNPFATYTTFGVLAEAVRPGDALDIYNAAGRKVRRLFVPASGVLVWDGRDQGSAVLPAGTYFYRLFDRSGRELTGKTTLQRGW